MSRRIGFIGLGPLGYNIARNLAVNASNTMLLWNRTIEKAQQLKEEVKGFNKRVQVASSVGQLVGQSDVIFTCLANDQVVKGVYEEMLQTKPSHSGNSKIFVECSTVYPTTTVELNQLVHSRAPQSHFVASPVLGGPLVAEKAQLVILMSGGSDQKKVVSNLVVPTVGRTVIDCGEDVQKASTLKLIVNSMVIGSVEVLAESFTLAEKSGVGAEAVHQAVKELFPAPVFLSYSDRLISGNFDGSKGFNLAGAIKDASHIRKLSSDHESPLPVVDIAHQHMVAASKLRDDALSMDWSAIIAVTRAEAGLNKKLGPKL